MATGFNGTDDGSGGGIHIYQAEHCRVAYTLNNTQPVRCSIVGDQPLFYMDFDGEIEEDFTEDMTADPFGIGAIEQGVAALKQRIMGFEQEGFSELAQIRLADFADTARMMTAIGEPATGHDNFRLKTLEKTLRGSRLIAALLDTAKTHGIGCAFSTQIENAFYDRDAKTIFLNPDRDDTDLTLYAIRELRRAWQHKNGALIHPLTFHPDQAILINRAQHADLVVTTIRAAWELQLAGNKTPWDRLDKAADDLTRAFAREAFLDFRTVNNGHASSAVFEGWFLSERCRHEDRRLIQAMLSEYQGYVFDSEQASKSVGADLMLALGSMPFGNNYLAPFVATIVSDPIFSEVRDRSNANFLWFIKFERSFREAEQVLQTKPEAKPAKSSITKKPAVETPAQKAEILTLPAPKKSRTAKKLPAAARAGDVGPTQDAGNIVYLNLRTRI